MKRTTLFLLLLCAAFIPTAIFYAAKTARIERAAADAAESALSSLMSAAEAMEGGIGSLSAPLEGRAFAQTAAKLYSDAQLAKASLSLLPLSDFNLLKLEKFINQAGDISLSLLLSEANGDVPDAAAVSSIAAMAETAKTLNERLLIFRERADCAECDIRDSLGAELALLEVALPDTALSYDGAFSDENALRAPLYIKNEQELSQDDAAARAAEFFPERDEALVFAYSSSGTIPAYGFFSGDAIIEIARANGALLSFTDGREIGAAALSENEGVKKAEELCLSLGFENCLCRQQKLEGGMLTALLVPVENGVALYPDAISVSVALDDGTLVYFNSASYMMNHTKRSLSLPALPEGASYALIASEGGREALCLEYDDGRFVDAKSGLVRKRQSVK